MTSCGAGYGDCNETGTDGCETPLNTEDNCGICGHSCNGAACNNGLCAATAVGSPAGAYRWVMTTDAIYRLDGNTPNYGFPTNYTLTRIPLDGSAEVIMASNTAGPGGLAADDTYVYWAVNGTPPAVFRKAHTAAAEVTPTPIFEPASVPVQLRIQGNDMYWMGLDGAIYKRPVDAAFSNAGTQIVSAAEVKGTGTFNMHQDFVLTPTAMYWVVLPTSGQEAFIRTAPLAGGTASNVPGAITNQYLKLSVVGEDLYWVRATGAAVDGVHHYHPDSGVEPLVIQTQLNAALADPPYLYMLENRTNVYRAPITGGASVRIGNCSGLAYCMDFAGSDPESIYAPTSFTHGSGFAGDYPTLSFPK